MVITTKRVYEHASETDGIRILVDRLWPRGIRKSTAAFDHWIKEIAPSPELRRWFDHRIERFGEFELRYRIELSSNPSVAEALAIMANGKVTLLYAARDPKVNHAQVLARFLRGLRRPPGD